MKRFSNVHRLAQEGVSWPASQTTNPLMIERGMNAEYCPIVNRYLWLCKSGFPVTARHKCLVEEPRPLPLWLEWLEWLEQLEWL